MAEELLVPMETYLKAGIHIGTKFKSRHMADFIFKIKQDGLVVMNLSKIDERLRVAASFIARYPPESIAIVCKRENCWVPAKLFGQLTGATVFAERYSPGTLTNLAFEGYREFGLLIVGDPWLDKNAIADAFGRGIPIVALCDSNSTANNIDLCVVCNNKGRKSLGLVFWILAREYLWAAGLLPREQEPAIPLEKFMEE